MNGVPDGYRTTAPRHARVVELVGPAGCGKSTLSLALSAVNDEHTYGPNLWGLPRPVLLRSALRLGPEIARTSLTLRSIPGGLLLQMIRVDALRHLLAETRSRNTGIILIDEGPVFALSWMQVFFPQWNSRHGAGWRERVITEWAKRLDAVVRLDADDMVLAQRIRTRAKWHPVKDLPYSEIRRFTARFREAFDRVLAELTAMGNVEVIDVRTDSRAADCVSRTGAALREVLHER